MSRINRRICAVLAVAFVLGLARQAAAQTPQPAVARRQIALGRYRGLFIARS